MNVRDAFEAFGNRVPFPLLIGSVPTDRSGDIQILYANGPSASLFGFPSPLSMQGMDVRSLMPAEIATDHRKFVEGYVQRANGGAVRVGSIMGSWRNLDAVRRDGSTVAVAANVTDVRNIENDERYFVAIFRERTDEIRRERALAEAVAEAQRLAEDAEIARAEAEAARDRAEANELRQQRLSSQVSLLRQIYIGTILLVVMLGVLLVAQWATGTTDPDGLAMVERVLLVLTGILGSAMANVFDSRNGDRDERR